MNIAILGAMPEEIDPLLEVFDTQKIDHANNTFYIAKTDKHNLIIVYSKIGKVNSALTATIVIEKFGAEILLFTGVAGALKEGLKIGDILYASSVVQHDLDITAFGHPHGFVPGSPIFVETDKRLNDIAIKTAKSMDLNICSGIIASGDQFINSKEPKEWIRDTFDASAAEMEGASVAQVCYALNIPFFLMRSISDEASQSAEFDFDKFMIESAKKSANFILKMIENL
ncbi:MAG: 5'-methylthioadenosine/adenosylhomocysteine nucleosidase [Campylobacter sp.]|nr:5'-methylthioadenosine/adenosylhomocysteine nucleosidase [Campylobacter sp.]